MRVAAVVMAGPARCLWGAGVVAASNRGWVGRLASLAAVALPAVEAGLAGPVAAVVARQAAAAVGYNRERTRQGEEGERTRVAAEAAPVDSWMTPADFRQSRARPPVVS